MKSAHAAGGEVIKVPVPVDHAVSIMSMTGARATADLIAEALS
jgi:hypothetical protein